MNKEIPGWFPAENRDTLEKLIAKHNVKSVVEIGTFVGLSTAWFAERVERVITIDPFDALTRIDYLNDEMKKHAEDQYQSFLNFTKEYKNIEAIKMTSLEAADLHRSLFADLIYIDGSHKYQDVKDDIDAWYPRANAVLCGDDYTEAWPEVRKAVDEQAKFTSINRDQRCWYIEKNHE